MTNMDMASDKTRDWDVTVPLMVPKGDTEGVYTEEIFEAALHFMPAEGVVGLTAHADTAKGKVRLLFTVLQTDRDTAIQIGKDIETAVSRAVLSDGDVLAVGAC